MKATKLILAVCALLVQWIGGMLMGVHFTGRSRFNLSLEALFIVSIFGILLASYLLKASPLRWLGFPSYCLGYAAFFHGTYTNSDSPITFGLPLLICAGLSFLVPETRGEAEPVEREPQTDYQASFFTDEGCEKPPVEKDPKIIKLLKRLDEILGSDNYQVVHNWDPDLCAVGIAHPQEKDLRVYICPHDDPTSYFASTEFPNDGSDPEWKDFPYIPGKEHNNLGFDELLAVIREHFGSHPHPKQ